ncbi:hypothetical protein QVD17_28235 [Tagetes erecta]|uniref:Cytochrome P450 n=1 Tax=Tagetes erecta TaxID=13708 RepID=A0AAD8KCF7_TARER|nr:hypothetical protein QVD17_28235 [Tagetes erecta]
MLSEMAYNISLAIINCWSWWWEAKNQHDALARTMLTISVPTLVYVWYKWTTSHLPPGPYGLPIIGYIPFLRSNLHEQFTEMAHKYGPIFSLQLGHKLHVVVNSMDLAKVVARDLDQTFANRSPPLTGLIITYGGMDIVWSNNNAHYRNVRKLLVSQVLSNANLNATQVFRTCEVRKAVNEVYTKIGTKIHINKIAFDTELNVVTNMLWGCSKSDIGDLLDGFQEVACKIIELIGTPNISDFIPFLSRFDLQGMQKEMQRQLEAQNDPKSFNIIHIKALLINILVAATDTTSTMTEWVMAKILSNPGVMKKVQEELTEVVGLKNIVEESHLPKLTYLDAVIKETFRLHPPLSFLIQRCPSESCKVGGYMIPKGTIIYINVWAIQRDPRNWTNPLEFNPERFLNGKWDYNGNNFKFLPFGSGRRICPGVPLGEKMLVYILASLLHSFTWSLPKDEEFELSDEFGFVTKKRKPLITIPSLRLSDASLYL